MNAEVKLELNSQLEAKGITQTSARGTVLFFKGQCSCWLFHLALVGPNKVVGLGQKAAEIRLLDTGELDGVFVHKTPSKLKYLCQRNETVCFMTSLFHGIFLKFMWLNRLESKFHVMTVS